jgi:competence protein ComEA
MTREQQWVVLFLGSFLVLFFFLTSQPSFSLRTLPLVAADDFSPKKPEEGELQVEVDGSVNRRGIYSVAKGERFLDALEKAGGVKDNLSLPAAMLLAKIEKSCRINVVPGGENKGRILLEPLAPQKFPVLSIPIPVNTANLEELMTLPGIGPKIAQAIIDCREQEGSFTSAEDLLRVRGIGSKKLAAIRKHITVP